MNAEGSLWFDNQADVLAEIMGHLARQERDIRGQDVYVRQCHEQLLAAQANLSSTTRAAEQERLRAMEFESRLMAAMQAAEQERVKATELARQKHDIQQSWSWRIGRFALGPARLARGAWAGLARSLSVAARLL